MERREFCRFLGVCAAVGCGGGLAGCARLLDRSDGSAADVREPKPGREATSQAAAGSRETTSTSAAVPDLAVYTGDDPERNVRAALGALGGMARFVAKGDRVLVKPNVLTARAPELAVTTNPNVVAAVVKLALEAGAKDVVVLDNPTTAARNAFEVSLIAPAVAAAGGRVKYLSDRDFTNTTVPKGRILKEAEVLDDVFDADVFINVPIAKTHEMAGLTMSMKNLMGILGSDRGSMHQDFDQKIVDLHTLVRPHLIVLDAYRILVRNGPTGGDPADVRTPKTCIAGTDPVAIDSLGASMFGMRPSELGYLVNAGDQGLGVSDPSRLRIQRGRA